MQLNYLNHHLPQMLLVKSYNLSLPSSQPMSSNIQQLPNFSGPLKSLYSLFSIPLLPFSSGSTPIRLSIPGLGFCQNQQRPSNPRVCFQLTHVSAWKLISSSLIYFLHCFGESSLLVLYQSCLLVPPHPSDLKH